MVYLYYNVGAGKERESTGVDEERERKDIAARKRRVMIMGVWKLASKCGRKWSLRSA